MAKRQAKRRWTPNKLGMGTYVQMTWTDPDGNRICRRGRDYTLQDKRGAIFDLEARTVAEAKAEVEQYINQ